MKKIKKDVQEECVESRKNVLDQGFVELIDYYPKKADLAIVNSARISFNQRSEVMGKREEGLINFLLKNRHGTPFEAVDFSFHVRLPIVVAREWMRHRVCSYNEISGRYRKLPTEFYLPARSDVRQQRGKPGNYIFEPAPVDVAMKFLDRLQEVYTLASRHYQEALEDGIAKEQARIMLPLALYTEFLYKTNLRSLMNFCSLRSHETAMWEIRQYSKAIEGLVREVVPVAWEAFKKNGRNQP